MFEAVHIMHNLHSSIYSLCFCDGTAHYPYEGFLQLEEVSCMYPQMPPFAMKEARGGNWNNAKKEWRGWDKFRLHSIKMEFVLSQKSSVLALDPAIALNVMPFCLRRSSWTHSLSLISRSIPSPVGSFCPASFWSSHPNHQEIGFIVCALLGRSFEDHLDNSSGVKCSCLKADRGDIFPISFASPIQWKFLLSDITCHG